MHHTQRLRECKSKSQVKPVFCEGSWIQLENSTRCKNGDRDYEGYNYELDYLSSSSYDYPDSSESDSMNRGPQPAVSRANNRIKQLR